jgi:hypothetical protein
MTAHEVICATCGAINRDAAEPCWRCRETLDPRSVDAPQPVAPVHAAS